VPIETVISSKEGAIDDILQLEFGTTLDADPLYASYGISSLRIYIR
jgi:hypothetical protein